MYSILTFLIVGTLWTVNCEKHTLNHIYTTFSKPVDLPGIHEFTEMALLDDRMIAYYDSSIRKKVPKQPWMEERMDKDYWERGTKKLQRDEYESTVNLGILIDRMRQSNDTGLHIYQARYGCTAEKKAGDDKSLKFSSGLYAYSYDCKDLLSFDHVNKRWIAPNDLGVPSKQKWDKDSLWTNRVQDYLERECVDWLSKLVDYGQEQLKNSTPPDLHMYGKKSKNPSVITLHCMATGFLFKEVTLSIMRDGKLVDPLDGLQTTGVRPNGDGTYQIMKRVEILRSDPARYRCEVTHPFVSNMDKNMEWDGSVLDDGSNIGVIAGGVVAGVLLLLVGVLVGVIVYTKTKQESKNKPSANSSDTDSTGTTSFFGKPLLYPCIQPLSLTEGNAPSNADATWTNNFFAQGSSSDGSTLPESISLMEGNAPSNADATSTNKAFAQGSSSDGSTLPESISLMEGNAPSNADATWTNKAFAQGSSSDGSTLPESISLMEGNAPSTAPV